jgi:hypothetical protein
MRTPIRFYIWTQLSTISWWSILLMEQTGIHRRKPLTCLKKHIPYLGFYNAQDFAQIFYFEGGVRIINRNNVFHSFTDREITCLPCFHGLWQKSSSEMKELNINRIYFSVLWACFIYWENLRTIYLFSSSIKLQNIKCVGFYSLHKLITQQLITAVYLAALIVGWCAQNFLWL